MSKLIPASVAFFGAERFFEPLRVEYAELLDLLIGDANTCIEKAFNTGAKKAIFPVKITYGEANKISALLINDLTNLGIAAGYKMSYFIYDESAQYEIEFTFGFSAIPNSPQGGLGYENR